MWLIIRILGIFLIVAACAAAGMNEDLKRGYDHFYNLEFDEALAVFDKTAAAYPVSPLPQSAISQTILYREMLRDGALESELIDGHNTFLRRAKMDASPETQARFTSSVQRTLELAEKQLASNSRDILALHARAVAYALQSNWNFLVRKAWRDALSDATNARKIEDQIVTIAPNDVDAKLGEGVHSYIIGDLPWTWRTLGFLVGFHGDKAKGLAMVEQVAKYGTRNKSDAEIFLCALYRRERRSDKAIPLLKELIARYPRNYILRLELSKMYSDIGDGKSSLAVLDDIEHLKLSKAAGLVNTPMSKIEFDRATVQFWYRDLDAAFANFQKVLANPHELDLSTGVLSYMREGQILDMKGKHQEAIEWYKRAIAFAPDADAAKESRRYIANPYVRKR